MIMRVTREGFPVPHHAGPLSPSFPCHYERTRTVRTRTGFGGKRGGGTRSARARATERGMNEDEREGASSRALRHCTAPRPISLARSREGGRASLGILMPLLLSDSGWKAICSLRPPPRPTTTLSADNGPRHASQPAKGRKAARSGEWREGLAIIFV